jgi:biopolymer transport protein ExbB
VDATTLLRLLHDGGLTVYPLALGSIISLAVLIERIWAYRGIERKSRELTRQTVQFLVQRDLESARELCGRSRMPLADIFSEAMRWKNVSLEDLERILATSRQEAAASLRRGLWLVGTIGSLAPYVGLFGTVVGIIRAFQDMAAHGAGGFEVVAAGISEALVATAAGLVVAIVSLAFYNWLQVQAQMHSATYARCCERFVQALLYVEASGSEAAARAAEAGHGHFAPAR